MQRSTSQQEDPRKAGTSCRNVVRACLLLGVGCLQSAGCGGQNGVSTEVIHGTVTVGGQMPETGRLRFFSETINQFILAALTTRKAGNIVGKVF